VVGLLQHPGVAVGIAEVGERAVVSALGMRARLPPARAHVADLADLDAAAGQFVAAATMSTSTRCKPGPDPGSASVMPTPTLIEQADPGQ
jgi:hypothetical protein